MTRSVHDARSSSCECICGGRLHGVGAERALAVNTAYFAGELGTELELAALREYALLRDFADRHELDVDELRLEVATPTLF